MKIAITSVTKDKESTIDERFGRCNYFTIYDTENKSFEHVENKGVTSAQGAGIAAGQQLVDCAVGALITGYVGPNAMRVLQSGKVDIYKCSGKSIKEEIELFLDNKLEIINNAVPAHSGMRNRNGRS
ncbi:MAG: NifB/NifX family molybdenum-iron cluster-binding protein [Anaeromicrobium sp.]|jgi:predicted Fe-Mo cluster-binding NifX family protein|uniref:NifB/NifX family molybdenum-iron cluster-binding protein n=1 Tax=Anaeromicrobium sp. TaxID=1929132 RepID=UPI0025EFE7EB|nr:NifB/NifX family molybdenum-iron cluster-binding protein [Anaeromicrobium sp.]MCT4595867.1 NifB/NifX family molybdenum-iron cluster-binding protein [Anaeromicrobium sp.]